MWLSAITDWMTVMSDVSYCVLSEFHSTQRKQLPWEV